jgi:hypothetical protein
LDHRKSQVMRKIYALSILFLFTSQYCFCQADAPVHASISGKCEYFARLKAYSEDIIYDFTQKELMMEQAKADSAGTDVRRLAKLQMIDAHKYAALVQCFNQLRAMTNSFLSTLEVDLTLINKTNKKDPASYTQILNKIDSTYGRLKIYKDDFDADFNAQIKPEDFNARSGEAASTSDGFSLLSLISDPLSIINDVVAYFESRRDFRAQQIQAINTQLESYKLSSFSDVKSGNSSGGASDSGSKGGGKGSKK